MYRLFCTKFILVLFLGGCAGLQANYEAFWAAKRHMEEALTMENSQRYPEAMIKYVYVAKNFPTSRFYKNAIFKAAMVSGRLDNPKRNLSTSLYWLNQYLKLPLSEQEQESIRLLIAFIEQNKQCQDRIAQLQTELQNQGSVISQKAMEIAAFEEQAKKRNRQIRALQNKIVFYKEQIKEQDKQIGQLQAEISTTRDALQRLKEIDVRIHKRRLK